MTSTYYNYVVLKIHCSNSFYWMQKYEIFFYLSYLVKYLGTDYTDFTVFSVCPH